MERRQISDRLPLFFDPAEQETANLIAGACEKSVHVIRRAWGLDVPPDCRVYVMTSWLRFTFHAAPWHWRILLGVTLPLWGWRARRMWAIAGGFHQPYGRRRAIGVKPPRLIQQADRSIGERIFVPNEHQDMQRKVRHVTCHELAHACIAHLRPPMWLNEGVAMVTVDLFAGEQTVRQDTLDVLARVATHTDSARYQDVRAGDADALIYHTVRGYWLTRYLQEQQPDLLKRLLSRRHDQKTLVHEMAQGLGIAEATFWQDIDGIVVAHFGQ